MYDLKDYLNSINYTKENLLDSEDEMWENKYPPFIVNRCLSGSQDTLMLVNEINTLITVFPNSIFENSKIYPFLVNVGSFLFDWATESKVLEGNQIV